MMRIRLLILSLCLVLKGGLVFSQDTLKTSGTLGYDPIAAALDSLVNLNYIQKLSFSSDQSDNNYKPYEVPSYSDEVYAKRIAKIQTPIPLVYNQQVREYIDLYAIRKRGLTERVMGLSNLYFPLFEQTLDQQGIPLEFKYLSIVESALNPTAVSRCGATGLWQFMLATGKLYDLKVTSYTDDRRDPVKATYAACQYFKDMYEIYHDWLLVVASYNCGAGSVNKAIARSGGKKTFWEISPYLPKETRGYVPAFIAVTYLMNYLNEHNLVAVPPIISFYEADTVLVDQRISLGEIAAAINTPEELLRYLNPVYKKGIIPETDESQVLRLPSNKVAAYIANVDNLFRPESDQNALLANADGTPIDPVDVVYKTVKQYHIVKKGENIYSIANKFSCSAIDIKHWNKLKGGKLYKGQKVLVYVKQPEIKKDKASNASVNKSTVKAVTRKTDTIEAGNKETAVKAVATTAAEPKVKLIGKDSIIYHVVQPGDTLWSIAKRYDGTTVEELKELNHLRSGTLKPGTRLKIRVAV
jgi:membrane-bound lytic murein transglycosylase D